jgi:hypothetical protein
MAQVLQVDSTQKTLHFGEQTTPLKGPMADLLIEALLTMLPAEKMPMMAPTTTRGYTLASISQENYDQLITLVAGVNQAFNDEEVLRLNFRGRGAGEPLQAKILLGEKSVVKSVASL